MSQLVFETNTYIDLSPEERRALASAFAQARQPASQAEISKKYPFAGAIRLPHLALRYGIDAPVERIAVHEGHAAMTCFLRCGRERENRGQLHFVLDDPDQNWSCDHRECGLRGNLASACDLMQPREDDARRRQTCSEEELSRMRIGLGVWEILAQHVVAAKIFHNAAIRALGGRAGDFILRCSVIEFTRDHCLLRDLLRKPDLGYREDRKGSLGVAGYLYFYAHRHCRRTAERERIVGRRGIMKNQGTVAFTDLDADFDPALIGEADPGDPSFDAKLELSVVVDGLSDPLREVGQRLLAGQSLRKIHAVFKLRDPNLTYDWVFKRSQEVKAAIRRAITGKDIDEP